MKKTIFASAILPLLFIVVSCTDFLERAPGDNLTEEELFSNIETAEKYLNNAYIWLPDYQYPTEDFVGRYKLGDATDEGGFQQGYDYQACPFDINLGSWNPNRMPMERNWSDYYGVIRRCNKVIANYGLIPEEISGGTPTNRRERILGEAYALRGFYYFMLFKQWGGVPIILNALDPGDVSSTQGIKRATAEETLDQVLSDLEEAKTHLPVEHKDGDFGRMNGLICTILESQVKLYWASEFWNPEHDMDRWDDAVEYTNKAFNMALECGHALAQDYSNLFITGWESQSEVIWVKNSNKWECHWWDVYAMPLGYGAFNVDGPLQEFVDCFEMKESGEIPVLGYTADNRQIVNPKAYDYDPLHPWDGREDRFYDVILTHGMQHQGRAIDISETGKDNLQYGPCIRTNYFNRKYVELNHNLYTDAGETYRRFAIMRMAELYLNYAEALNETEGPTGRCIELVNTIRRRANVKEIPSGLSKDEMTERIRHERKIELCFENHRFWDVRRWKIAEVVDKGTFHKVYIDADGNISYPVFQNRVFEAPTHYLWPIPQGEIDKNRLIEQNPGWSE